jgi:hypothetical protein
LSGVFSIFNTKVTFYLDTGTGAPKGSALWEGKFLNAISTSLKGSLDYISHAGHVSEEIAVGNERYTLQLEKGIESTGRDLTLTNALYYIKVEVWTDDRSEWSYYACKKCRRESANINHAVPTITSAVFQCESIIPVDV